MKKFIILSLSILVLGSGCSLIFPRSDGKNTTHHYVLEYHPQVVTSELRLVPWPANVRVRDFSITEPYGQNEIVYRQSKYQMGLYNFELWAVKPELMISDMVFRHLRDAKVFQQVSRSIELENVDHILRGEITALEEVDQDSSWFAHLAMSMYLVDNRNQGVVWTRSWDMQEKILQKEPEFVVRSLSHLLEIVVTEAVEDLDSAMGQVYQPNSNIQSSEPKQEKLAPPIDLPPPANLE